MAAPLILEGDHVRLEPLSHEHTAPLLMAAAESRETYAYTLVPDDMPSMTAYVADALRDAAAGQAVPFAVLANERVVGSTRLHDFMYWSGREFPDALEIGHTWYAASAQRTACNTEAKLLLLTHAFDSCGVVRVTLKTDARNSRSRAAIARIGGKFEGIRRAHRLGSDGTVRDTAYFSIVAAEWPTVRADLREKLSAYGDTGSRSVARMSP